MRLQRALARAGIASRRRAEDLIRGGGVKVNGQVATIGATVDPDRDVIVVRGRRVKPVATTWIALHKPVGYVVSRHDPRGRPTVFELVPEVAALTYVGRLDVMTSGLLLLTTDGIGAHRLTHPRYAVERTYRVLVHGRSGHEIRQRLERRIVIDGRAVQLVQVHVREQQEAVELTLGLAEGRYRIVRRLCEHLGLKVERLIRLSYGPVRLGRLARGKWRHLTQREREAVDALRAA
ncbi:MAG: rRNA pseudouridine synthase [Gemmatimonadota bacterium]|nr:rRNA pseudouridine synthase [Gemmatimonadota bacterium]